MASGACRLVVVQLSLDHTSPSLGQAAGAAYGRPLPSGGDLYVTAGDLYAIRMATMNISAAREKLPRAVELARTEAVFLERYGRRAAVLLSPERYDALMAAAEEAEDVAAFDAAMSEEGPNIPWAQVKADLGWE